MVSVFVRKIQTLTKGMNKKGTYFITPESFTQMFRAFLTDLFVRRRVK